MIAMSLSTWLRDWLTLGSRSDDVIKELEEQRRRAAAVRRDMQQAAGDQVVIRQEMRAKVGEEDTHGLKIPPPRQELKSSAG